jgi:N-dimethylarginine dimethylaminohydrolase
MTREYGCQSMVDPIRKVVVRRPDSAFGSADPERWHYTSQPDLRIAQEEHDALVEILRHSGSEVVYHDAHLPKAADAIFVHDPAIVTDAGAIILRMGKELRRGEEEAIAACFNRMGIPIHAHLEGDALAEGGDLMWIDNDILAVGLGFRTNIEGLKQLAAALEASGAGVTPVPLPYGDGPDACLHLMSLISMLDRDLAAVYIPLLPVPFVELLHERGVQFVEVPKQEFPTMGTNVLALAPRRCLMLEGNPITKKRLEAVGCEVLTYKGEELSLKAEGGPTCLTRPVLRRP